MYSNKTCRVCFFRVRVSCLVSCLVSFSFVVFVSKRNETNNKTSKKHEQNETAKETKKRKNENENDNDNKKSFDFDTFPEVVCHASP